MLNETFPIQARPTEYEGIRFRSKSEAIFARCLSLDGFYWEYEPETWRIGYGTKGGWTPDFWAVSNIHKKIHSLVIEYKPGPPTNTYIEELAKRFDSLWPQTHGHHLVLCFGSAFERNIISIEWLKGLGKWKTIGAWPGSSTMKQAAAYRFDLAQ